MMVTIMTNGDNAEDDRDSLLVRLMLIGYLEPSFCQSSSCASRFTSSVYGVNGVNAVSMVSMAEHACW